MRLRIVKSKMNEADREDDEDNISHGIKVLNELVLSWSNTARILCLDSYFPSLPPAE